MKDYVIFGGSAGNLTGAVQTASSVNIQGGNIGSYRLIKTTGTSSINSNLFSGGNITLANSNTITGRIAAANNPVVSGTIVSIGSGFNLTGNIDANGNVVVAGGNVNGSVTVPSSFTYSGPLPSRGFINGSPVLPTLPQMPASTVFPVNSSTTDITTTTTITPGNYRNMSLTSNKTVTFRGTGIYVFNKIANNCSNNNFIFDFQNNATGTVKIYITNDADLGKISVSTINGGDASRIFTEVHGTGSTITGSYAFNIANGSSASAAARWLGTVWANNGSINIGSGTGNSYITGALWSTKIVNIQNGVNITYTAFNECVPPNANAGIDKSLNFDGQATLNGSSTTSGATFSWESFNGGTISSASNTATIYATSAGTYVLTVSTGTGCISKDTAIVTGKNYNLIGSELSALYQNFTLGTTSPFFIIKSDSIYIDIICKENQYAATLALVTSPAYGLTNLRSNGNSNFIITGKFPIVNLPLLNQLPQYIVYVRPYYSAISNSGIVTTAGDISVKSDLVRKGYNIQGDGVKIGVMSNSYSTIQSATTTPITNTASQDVANGDLPGLANPNGNTTPVHLLKDYPFTTTDEGRAMLQIIHDIAPKAELYFRTGFISPGDMAKGIVELKDSGCNVIVDDITMITEPFLQDGVCARAVDAVAAAGTTYISAAGNFSNKSYENSFNAVSAPAGTGISAHNFGNGDLYQSVTLTPGDYTIVLQWLDDIYSIGQTSNGGTKNDLDIYLTPNTNGTGLFGFNRDNTNGDPIEILPFTLGTTTTTNIFITNNTTGTNPSRIKYIIFRGNAVINEYNTGTSTIVGQSNAAGAITVGAVRYDKASPYAGPLAVESFSSTGGTIIGGTVRNKPDVVAPDGVNTTVNMGQDYPASSPDGYSNFFGTSAAAPHVAAVTALLMEGRRKFSLQNATSPAEIRTLLTSTATSVTNSGFNFESGYGFINSDAAMRTFAKPKPDLLQLQVPDSRITPGTTTFTLTVRGINFSPSSVIKFRDSALATNYISSEQLTATIPPFIGDPTIYVYTPPISTSGIDGGYSDTLKFFNVVKKNIFIKANNTIKKYAQELPAFSSSILVDGDSLQNTGLTEADLGLSNLGYVTQAGSGSDVGTYVVSPVRVFSSTDPADIGYNELYNYEFVNGTLSVEKLPLTISANDASVTYGEKIPDVTFNYQFDATDISDSAGLQSFIQSSHQQQIAKDERNNDIFGIVNGRAVTIVNGRAVPIVNGQEVSIVNGRAVTIVNGRAVPIVNGQAITIVNGRAVPIVNNLTEAQIDDVSFLTSIPAIDSSRNWINRKLVNGIYVLDSTKVVDITQESVLSFNDNSAQTTMLTSVTNASPKGLIDINNFNSGEGITIVGDQAINIANGRAVTIVNGRAVTIVNGRAVTIVNGNPEPIVSGQEKTAVVLNESEIGQGQHALKSLNMVTGIVAGNHFILPGTFQNSNFEVNYIAGTLTILPASVTITPLTQTKTYGDADTTYPFSNNAGLTAEDFTGSLTRDAGENAGVYAFGIGTLSAGDNYLLTLDNTGTFTINPRSITIIPAVGQSKAYGDADPVFIYSPSETLLSGNSFTGNIGRTSGENTGTYSFNLGTLNAGNNYQLTLGGNAVFTITKKSITITPITGQGKVYGDNDPLLIYTNNAGLSSSTFTGSLSRAAGNNAGSYAITQGTLSAGDNYAISFTSGVLFTISKATLTVKADDKYMFKGDAYPVYTSTITGLKYTDNPAVTFTLSPSCAGNAGVYTITPVLNSFANAGNYTITYVTGKLYINPKGTGAKAICVYLSCVEDRGASYLPVNRRYVARFYATNANTTALYLPIGTDNLLTSTGSFDRTLQPVVFNPGTTSFTVPFDGVSLKWDLRSYESSTKTLKSVTASSTSTRCTTTTVSKSGDITVSSQATQKKSILTVSPNPVAELASINLVEDKIDIGSIRIYDVQGTSYPVTIKHVLSENKAVINTGNLNSGYYILKVNGKSGAYSLSFIKE